MTAGEYQSDSDKAKHISFRTGALDFAHRIADFWDRHLGERLIGVYLIGSLAHRGFSTRYSDIDMAVLANDALTSEDLTRMVDRATTLSTDLAPKLSLFWTDRQFSIGRFPPLDRVDLIDHGIALIEREHVRPPRPTLSQIRAYLGAEPLRNWALQVEKLSALTELIGANHKAYLRALLYPARFAYSWMTGAMASNDVAVAWLRSRAPTEFDVDLIERALQCRNQNLDPDHLFPERSKLLLYRDACLQLAAEHP
jgi:predicted nucleotidyltransferase